MMKDVLDVKTLELANSEERDLINQLLGQVQATGAIAKLTSTVEVSKMAYVKENKLYRGLKGMKNLDGRGLSGTWEEFCALLNTSVAKVNEDIGNLQAFGEEALESMSRMGIGYREMRQYRRLPDDQKVALLEVAKDGDKDSFIDLAEQIISKHSKEKEELESQVADQERIAADLAVKLDTAETEKADLKAALKKQRAGSDYPDYVVVTRHESASLSDKALLCIDDLSRLSSDLVEEYQQQLSHPETASQCEDHIKMAANSLSIHLSALLARTVQTLNEVNSQFEHFIQPMTSELIYTESELIDMIQNRELLVQDHKQEAAIRANKRAADKPRGRGRPKKLEIE